jgi:hypothetical protein
VRKARLFNLIALVAGAVGLAVLLARVGWEGTRDAIVDTGAWFAVMAAIDLGSVACDTFAIHGMLRPKVKIGYWRVFGAQASGLAINRLTPGNSVGEAVKVTMLVRTVPTNLAVSTIVLYSLLNMYMGVTAIVIGVPLTALLLDLSPTVSVVVWIATGVLVAVAVTITLIVRRGAVGTLIDIAAGFRIVSSERAGRWRARVAEIDARLREVRDTRSSGIYRGIAGVVGSRACNWLGTIVVLHATHIPLTPPLVVATLSVGILVTWATNVIPLGLGVADGTNYVLYGLLGATQEAGLFFTGVNRVRTCVLAAMGLSIMAVTNAVYRSSRAEA